MNKQLLELYKKAQVPGIAIDPTNNMHYETTHFSAGKFAELMVKKFDDILMFEQLGCIGNKDKKSVLLLDRIRDKTKTYFGVEE